MKYVFLLNNSLITFAHIILCLWQVVSPWEIMGPEYGTREFAPSWRHKEALNYQIGRYLKNGTVFAEITSGTGQFLAYMAKNFPQITFIPTDHDSTMIRCILEYVEAQEGSNLMKPFFIDVRTDPARWFDFTIRKETVDFMFNSNLIHLAPPECYKALFRGCARFLKRRGLLFMFGPFKYFNTSLSLCHAEYDATLRKANPLWGLRDVELELAIEAEKNGLYWVVSHNFPFPGQLLIFKKGSRLLQSR